ncbi:MAG: DUF1822 family protein [Oscillatoria sp. SIO1A7]|nr:DUF1822 family protein [Oscillatoria sp. SIO1A7]
MFRPDTESVTPQDKELWDAVVAGETPSYMMPGTLERISESLLILGWKHQEIDLVVSTIGDAVEECEPFTTEELSEVMDLGLTEEEAYIWKMRGSGIRIINRNIDDLYDLARIRFKETGLSLEELKLEALATDPQLAASPEKVPALSKWFNEAIDKVDHAISEAGWLLYDEVFGNLNYGYGLRFLPTDIKTGQHTDKVVVRRVKTIKLKNGANSHLIYLIINVIQDAEDNTVWILFQLRSQGEDYMPEGLELIVVDDAGTPFDRVKAGKESRMLQLDDWLGDEPRTKFSVLIVFGDAIVTESFCI